MPQTKTILNEKNRILVVGPFYDKIEKLNFIQDIRQPDDIVIFLGDICFPNNDLNALNIRVQKLQAFLQKDKTFYILGNHDLSFRSKLDIYNYDIYNWINKQYLAIKINFENETNALIVHGGILPRHSKFEDLNQDLEISFNNEPSMHQDYNGRFGYLITSHPKSEKNQVELFNYSMSLDTSCHETNILAVQELTKMGLGQTFYF